MDDQITLTERRKLFDKGIAAFATLGFADQPVAKNILLGEQRQALFAKAGRQGQYCQGNRSAGCKTGFPVVTDDWRLDVMILEQVEDTGARSLAVAGDNCALVRLLRWVLNA